MKRTLAILTFAMLAVVNLPGALKAESPGPLVLAKFHADWCPSCIRWDKVSPGFADLKRYAESRGITVVVFDLTDDARTARARQLAVQHKVEKVFDATNATGFALIIDARTGNVVQRLESGSANLFFLDSLFSEDAQKAFDVNRSKIDAAVTTVR